MLDNLLGVCLCHVLANLEKWSDIPQVISVNKTVYNWYQRNFYAVWEYAITFRYPDVRVPDYVQGNQIIPFAHALSFTTQVFQAKQKFLEMHKNQQWELLDIMEHYDLPHYLSGYDCCIYQWNILPKLYYNPSEKEKICYNLTKVCWTTFLSIDEITRDQRNQQLALSFLWENDKVIHQLYSRKMDSLFGVYFDEHETKHSYEMYDRKYVLICESSNEDLVFGKSNYVEFGDLLKFMFELWRFGFRWNHFFEKKV